MCKLQSNPLRFVARPGSVGMMNALRRSLAGLPSTKLLPALFVGTVMGTVLVIHCVGVAAVIFSGPLSPFALQGVGMLLFGGLAFCFVIAVTSDIRGVISLPQEVPAVILATVGATMAVELSGAGDDVVYATTVALLVISGLLTGLCCIGIGALRVAGLFRFLPYPVMCGFFAGTGLLMSLVALTVMSGLTADWTTLPRFMEPEALWKWGPGVAYGVLLFVIMKRLKSLPVAMASFVLAAALYHVALALLDISFDEARRTGLLLSSVADGEVVWPAFHPADLKHVDWGVLAGVTPEILAVAAVTIVHVHVCLAGMELANGVDLDPDREFGRAGLAGTIAALGGSSPGCHSFSFSQPSWHFGADTRLTGILAAAILGLTLFSGTGMLQALPLSIIGGMLLFIGLDLLDNWLITIRKRLGVTDFGIVLTMFAVIAYFGFIVGIGVGLFLTVFVFAARFAKVDVIAEEFIGGERFSGKLRSIPERTVLAVHGSRFRGYRLRGYLFFGSVHRVVDRMKQSLADTPPPDYIMLDLSGVSGIDVSATNALCGFIATAHGAGTAVFLAAAPGDLENSLRENLSPEARNRLVLEADMDHALERCEDRILAMFEKEPLGAWDVPGHMLDLIGPDLEKYLDRQILFEELMDELAPWLTPRAYEKNEALVGWGTIQAGLQFLVEGRASVHDAEGRRLAERGPGDTVAQRAAFVENVVSVSTIAQGGSCRTLLLTPASRLQLESSSPQLCLKLYAFLLAEIPIDHAGTQVSRA